MAEILRIRIKLTPYIGATALVIAAFLLGGGSRGDIQSLIVLRPLSVVLAGTAVWFLTAVDLRRYPFMTIMAACVFLLAAIHLAPLPPAIWQALPGRDLVADIDQATGVGSMWRSISMTPSGARNAFFALFVPLGLYLFLVQLSARQVARLGLVFVALAILSALVGLLQAAGLAIHLYRIDTPASGLFSNHNHQAIVLATVLPLVAFLASERGPLGDLPAPRRLGLALVAAVFIVPGTLVAGSRAGLAALLLALVACPFIYASGRRAARSGRGSRLKPWMGAIALIVVGGLISWLFAASGQNAGIDRLVSRDLSDESRWPAWLTTMDLTRQFFPFGSGSGSFVEAFQIAELTSQLGPAYMNHAHNDWLEVAMTFGLPGLLLLAAVVVALALTLRRLVLGKPPLENRAVALAGVNMVGLLGLASIVDYPIRVPSVSCLFVYATFLAHFAWRPADPSDTKKFTPSDA